MLVSVRVITLSILWVLLWVVGIILYTLVVFDGELIELNESVVLIFVHWLKFSLKSNKFVELGSKSKCGLSSTTPFVIS